jgi:hypothetical protein
MIRQFVKYIVYFLCLPIRIFLCIRYFLTGDSLLSHAFHPHNEILLFLGSSLFWDVVRRRLVVRYRRFGTTYGFQLQELSAPRKIILRLLYPWSWNTDVSKRPRRAKTSTAPRWKPEIYYFYLPRGGGAGGGGGDVYILSNLAMNSYSEKSISVFFAIWTVAMNCTVCSCFLHTFCRRFKVSVLT